MASSIGEILKEARTKKAVSLEEVYSRTKIHPTVLKSLEEDKFDKLPNPLFVKNFIRSYAQFLEVSADDLVKRFDEQGRKDPKQVIFLKPAEYQAPTVFAPEAFRFIFIAAALILGLWFLGHVFKAAGAGVSHWRDSMKTMASQKSPKSKAESPTTSKSGSWLYSSGQGNFPKIAANAPIDLEIRALNDVWLRVTCDGKVLFESILKKGVSNSWSAKESVEIWTGNPSSMQVTVNRASLDNLGKLTVRKFLITQDGVRALS